MPSRKKKAPPTHPRISCAKDGPYLVKDLDHFSNSRGGPIKPEPWMALCRCGESKKKPFCDGTHKKIGFKSEKLEGRVADKRDDYKGKDITIHDNRGICAHAGFCTDNLKTVWKMKTEPWIDPDGASPEEIAGVIRLCPSSALSYSTDDVEHRDQQRDPEIRLSKDGPYWVRGGVVLEETARGEGASTEHFALCRCGGSKNKPFCDGTHWYIKFQDDERLTMSTDDSGPRQIVWHKAAEEDELSDPAIKAVTLGGTSVVLTHIGGRYGAVDAACPHQGGPLGEGSLDAGRVRCPWHGWSFDPVTGDTGSNDRPAVRSYDVEKREDGIYIAVEEVIDTTPTVSDVMVQTMVNWGVRHVFGMVGHSNLGLAEAIRKKETDGDLTFIGIRHEGAAAFACSAYAKLTGTPAACLTIAGPGATNLLTGLWDAHVDRAPVLALTGQVQTQVLGPGAFQEIDQASAFEAVATWSQTVLHSSGHAELMGLALKHAIIERGVGHLIFPDEVQVQKVPDEPAGSPEGRIATDRITPDIATVEDAVKLIASSDRPVIIVGHGSRNSMKEVISLAGKLGAPVLTTFKGKGQIPDAHPLAAGVLGRSGTPVASHFMDKADLLIVFGASFAQHTGIDSAKKIIQVDFERMALGKFHPVTLPIWGEIGTTASLFCDRLPASVTAQDQKKEIAAQWELWRGEKRRRMARDEGRGLNSASIFATLSSLAPENAVIAVDVGNNTYSFGRYFESKNQTVLMSGYLGSIGFALPAALGAWAASPGRPIISISGDGGFGQYMGEFTTAVKYRMNITHILLNNGELGKISKEQRAGGWQVWQTSLHNPNFAEFATLCGGYGVRVDKQADLDAAITSALGHDGPALVEIISDAALV